MSENREAPPALFPSRFSHPAVDSRPAAAADSLRAGTEGSAPSADIARRIAQYASVRLTTDLPLSDADRKMLPPLIEAAQAMDAIYWREWYGERDSLLARISDSLTRRYVDINVGPWDRLDELKPFVPGVGPAPEGARLYPSDMTKAEFDPAAKAVKDGGKALRSAYTVVRRDPATRALTMFHEVAHGLGIKETIDGRRTVRKALKEQAGALEEEKADILGLYLLARLDERRQLEKHELKNNFVTFLAGIFRSVRFSAADAHGRANVATLNVFREMGAFAPDSAGTYRVDFDRMRVAVDSLSARILRLQGDGDYAGVQAFMRKEGAIPADLQEGLMRLAAKSIPVDVVFEQGLSVVGGR